MNTLDLLLLLLIIGLLALAVRRIHLNKKAGRGCCGDCTACAGLCAKKKNTP